MTQNTKIEWADHTFNPWWGCTKISPACDHCYAASLDKRTGGDHWGTNQPRKRTSAKNWLEPVKWNKQAGYFFDKYGRRQRVFCASMADVFDNAVDPQWREDLFMLIAMTPNLDWLLLTKRIGNAAQMMDAAKGKAERDQIHDVQISKWKLWQNVWLGATICNQEEADRDIPKLLTLPAAKRFLSIEPMLGPVDLTVYHNWLGRSKGGMWCPDCPERGVGIDPAEHHDCLGEVENAAPYTGIDWVICGGESGPGARPMHPNWAQSLRDQCDRAQIPFLFKQWGDWLPGCEATCMHEGAHSDGQMSKKISFLKIDGSPCKAGDIGYLMEKTTKKVAGRELDGMEHNEVPA